MSSATTVAIDLSAMLTVLVPFGVLFVGANGVVIRWLVKRLVDGIDQRLVLLADDIRGTGAKVVELERDLLRLQADLPVHYVRREDWIRYGSMIDAKIDGLREATVGTNLRLERLLQHCETQHEVEFTSRPRATPQPPPGEPR